MNKEKIILKIEELYQSLIDTKYEHWYARDTMTSYENSYEFDEAEALMKDRDNFISQLENNHV